MEDPWADSAAASDPLGGSSTQQSSADDNTTTAATGSQAISGNPPSTTNSSSSSRPSRLTPRRFVAQPTRLQAVEDDPLGPLGAAATAAATPPLPTGSSSPAAIAGQEGAPPVPPLKENNLPLRTTMPPTPGSATSGGRAFRTGPRDPHHIDDDDDEDGDGEGGGDGQIGSGRSGRQPPPVQAAVPSSVRSATHPSVSIEQAAKPSFQITVGDPHKVGDLTSSHIVYSVRTKVWLSCFSFLFGDLFLVRSPWSQTRVCVCHNADLEVTVTDNVEGLPAKRVRSQKTVPRFPVAVQLPAWQQSRRGGATAP